MATFEIKSVRSSTHDIVEIKRWYIKASAWDCADVVWPYVPDYVFESPLIGISQGVR